MKKKQIIILVLFLFLFSSQHLLGEEINERDVPIRGFTLAGYNPSVYFDQSHIIRNVLSLYEDAGIYITILVTFDIRADGTISEGGLTPSLDAVEHAADLIKESGNFPCLSLYFDPEDKEIHRHELSSIDLSSAVPVLQTYFEGGKTVLRPSLINISPEMVCTEYNNENWKRLIDCLRRLFPETDLAYSAHYTSPLLKRRNTPPEWVDGLDYIGANLIGGVHVNMIEEQQLFLNAVCTAVEILAEKTGKKVLFTEYGFPAHSAAAVSPYDFRKYEHDEKLQNDLFKHTLSYIKKKSAFFWSFSLDDITDRAHYFWYWQRLDHLAAKRSAEIIDGFLLSNKIPQHKAVSLPSFKTFGKPALMRTDSEDGTTYHLSRPVFVYKKDANFQENPLGMYYYVRTNAQTNKFRFRQTIPINGSEFTYEIKGWSFASETQRFEKGKMNVFFDPYNPDESGNPVRKDQVFFSRPYHRPSFNQMWGRALSGYELSGFTEAEVIIEVEPSDFATVLYSFKIVIR